MKTKVKKINNKKNKTKRKKYKGGSEESSNVQKCPIIYPPRECSIMDMFSKKNRDNCVPARYGGDNETKTKDFIWKQKPCGFFNFLGDLFWRRRFISLPFRKWFGERWVGNNGNCLYIDDEDFKKHFPADKEEEKKEEKKETKK
jgi:hypothetical protein